MTEIDEEVRNQVQAALDRGDIMQVKAIFDALEAASHPLMVHVELTQTQWDFIELVKENLKMPCSATVIRTMLDTWRPHYMTALKKEQEKAKA